MSRTKADVEDDKTDRFVGLIFIPVWMPIKLVGIIVGALCELLWKGFREGRELVRTLSLAWRGPDKE